jgi:tellurite resistance protein
MSREISVQEALVYAMVTMSAVDRIITDAELAKIGAIVNQLPAFAEFDAALLPPMADACGKLLAGPKGLDRVLDLIAQSLPARLYETAYALAVDVAAVDLDIANEEVQFLELLRKRLGLDKLTVAAIERGACARHRS